MRLVVDTGVFSAAISRRRRQRFEAQVQLLTGNQLFLAAPTISELRYGALVAQWGDARRSRLDEAIRATTVIPVSDTLLTGTAQLRTSAVLLRTRWRIVLTPTTFGSPLPPSTSTPRL